jgi:hypothetical protein
LLAQRLSHRSDDHERWRHLDIHDVGRQPEFPDDCKRYRSEGFVDFDTLDVALGPAGTRQSACFTAGIGPRPNRPGSTAAMP